MLELLPMNVYDKVDGFMSKFVITAEKAAPLYEVRDLFSRHGFHHLPVVENNSYVGMISSNDLLVIDSGEYDKKIVSDIMSQEIKSLIVGSSIRDAAEMFCKYNINALVVLDSNNEIQGIITSRDLVKFILHQDAKEVE
jgi:predicted transcriptional regulator